MLTVTVSGVKSVDQRPTPNLSQLCHTRVRSVMDGRPNLLYNLPLAFPFLTCVSAFVTRWYCVETAKPIVKLSTLPGSPMILVF